MSRRLHEAVISGLLFATAAVWGTVYWNHSLSAGRQPSFYQQYFEPAVMMACGHGFRRANPPVRAVTDFILLKRDRIECTDIPASTQLTDRGVYQKTWLYLLSSVALAWRLLGVSWSGLGPLFGVLFGATIAVAYGVFRVGMNRVVSVCCAIALSVSAVHLLNLPHLRDYAKAPFTLGLIFLLFTAVAGPVTRRRLLLIAAAYGLVLGIGYGFRTDFLIDIPLFLVVLFGFLDGGPFRLLPIKLVAAVVFAVTFAISAWPVIAAVRTDGGCQWHAALLGLTDGPSDALMITRAPYDFGHDFSDDYVYSAATAYARRTQPGAGHIEYCSPAYDRVTGRYVLDVAAGFPGDMVTRTLASIVQVLQLPFRWFDQPLPGLADTLYRVRLYLLKPLRGSGVVFMTLTIVALASVSLRLGLFALFFLFYVGGYPMLQFDVRHYFHLEFMTWWAMGFLIYQLARHWRSAPDRRVRTIVNDALARYEWRRGLKTAGAAAAGIIAALWLTRGYQQLSAARLLQQYVDAPKSAIRTGNKANGVLHRIALGHDVNRDDPYPAEMIEVDLNVPKCGAAPAVSFLYDRPFDSFSYTARPGDRSAGTEPTRIFEPVYAGFAGVRFSDTTPGCIDGVYRITDPERFRLLLGAELSPSWRSGPLYQRFVVPRWRR